MPDENKETLADLPKIVEELLGKTTAGASGTDNSAKTPVERLKALGLDDAAIDKIRALGTSLIGDDISLLPKSIQDKIAEEKAKSQNVAKDQLYQTIEHLKSKNEEILAKLNAKERAEADAEKLIKDAAEKARLEKLSADEKITEVQKKLEESLAAIRETAEKENRELRSQIKIRDLEKLRDSLLAGQDIIVELIPQITADTTEESLKSAVENAKQITENYRNKYGANKENNGGTQNQNGAGGNGNNNGGVLPNNKGGRNSVDYAEISALMKDINSITDVKELEKRVARIAQLQGAV